MSRLRTVVAITGLLTAIAAWGCSSAGDKPASNQPAAAAQQLSSSSLQVSSPNFQELVRPRKRIPLENTCYGGNVSPPLTWSGVPEGTESLALIAEDADHHTGIWVQWVLYNIPPDATGLPGGIATSTDTLPDGTLQGANDERHNGYTGPCPPPVAKRYDAYGYSTKPVQAVHRFYFRLYALDADPGLAPGATKAELVSAMEGHILAEAETMGKYSTSVKLEMQEN